MFVCIINVSVWWCCCSSGLYLGWMPSEIIPAWSATKSTNFSDKQTKKTITGDMIAMHEWMNEWKCSEKKPKLLLTLDSFLFFFMKFFCFLDQIISRDYRMNNRRQSILKLELEIRKEFGLWLYKWLIVINVDNWLNHWNWVN